MILVTLLVKTYVYISLTILN